MMTNLFSIFDPAASPNFWSSNWTAIMIFLFFSPTPLYLMKTRYNMTYYNTINYIMNEFKNLLKKSPFTLIMPLSLFILIFFNNLMGLFSFIFTPTSHMTFTLTFALPLWLSLMFYSLINNTSNYFAHLIPQGTPTLLMPFMVMIETISGVIRPLTLAIRLAANMIAGHLLIVLLSSASPLTPIYLTPLMMSAQLSLTCLELAVAVIQAYVFSVLVTLYISDSIN